MKVTNIKVVTNPEAKHIMIKREKKGELGYEQKLAVEHLKKFTKVSHEKAEKLVEELSGILRMAPETLVQIVNLMPKNPDELRFAFAREKFSLKEDEINKLLEILKKYS